MRFTTFQWPTEKPAPVCSDISVSLEVRMQMPLEQRWKIVLPVDSQLVFRLKKLTLHTQSLSWILHREPWLSSFCDRKEWAFLWTVVVVREMRSHELQLALTKIFVPQHNDSSCDWTTLPCVSSDCTRDFISQFFFLFVCFVCVCVYAALTWPMRYTDLKISYVSHF